MASVDYVEIARNARAWQLEQDISPHRRRLAKSLYELASQLIDPDYGCPTETLAILAMHKHLQRTGNGLH
ncbi:MAG: hypothetical protein IPJ48_03510 [Propionivibrio sp.]|uniref:Uncharacterized protein n=1 Tax=Candidatus Propionivibrio dominans TaxID=2954373 RepID=A0A9D7IBT7_9RHOO|nr:hypothetical protein [Candidatus Propionivibrio dominans]MBL0165983.1 hypothetical protein [Propionivibrio sp.]